MLSADLRQALRSLHCRPAFALTAILTVALGVGANTAVYRVIYSVLLRPLPFQQPDRLVQLWESTPALPQLQASVPDFEDWRSQAHNFVHMAAYTFQAIDHITLIGQGEPEVIQGTNVTANLFAAMGIEPLLGRSFSPGDDRDRRPVALLSENLWRRKVGADPAVVGRAVRLETESFTVIGIVPSRQAFPAWADVWLPFSWMDSVLLTTRRYHPLEVIARLRPGVSESAAGEEMRALAARLAAEQRDTNGTVSAYAVPLAREITGEVRPALLLVWAAVGLVLLMACANLAHMLLARMLDRRQEMAVRASLGAGRARLVRLVLTESLLLALAGGACGAALATSANTLLARAAQGRIPRLEDSGAAGYMPLFVLAVTLLSGVLFALPACAQAMRAQSNPAAGRSMSRARSPLSCFLIGAEVAMAFVVLMGAALLLRSFAALLNEDPGFQAKHVLAVGVPLPSSRYTGEKTGQLLNAQLLPAVRSLPGVEAAAAANCAPMTLGITEHTRYASRFGIEGRVFESGHYPVAQLRWVTPDYFRVLRIPLLSGRPLTEADRDQPRYLVNETLARRFFPRGDATAHRLVMGVMDPQPTPVDIVGVAGDVRDMGLDEPVPPMLYVIGNSPYMTLLIRTAGDPAQLAGAVRYAVHRADPEVAVTKSAPVEDYVAASLAGRRFALNLLSAFAVLAALLTAACVYGLLAYSVSGRLREFGIRSALGATPAGLQRQVLREGAAIAIPGIAAGCVISLAVARLVKSMLYHLSPLDPLSLAAVTLLLVAITVSAVWLPARRAAAVDPGAALRVD